MTVFVRRIVHTLSRVQVKEQHADIFSNKHCSFKQNLNHLAKYFHNQSLNESLYR